MPADLRTALAEALGPAVTLGEELGGGAMARVFRARDTALGRDIVVKVLAPELAGEVSAERFRREIAVAASLVHPQVVPVLAAGDAGGMPWYTMPFVAGASLAQRMAGGAPLAGVAATSVLRDVARALAAAHAQGVVHRDVKPGNVLLVGDAAVVTDFGIAKAVDAARTHDGVRTPAQGATLTRAGMAIGTPAYMAPEQVAGEQVDARADVYAWGVVAYELLARRHPFAEATTTQRVLAAHLGEVPAPLGDVARDAPPALADVVMRALAKEPGARYADGSALLAAIDAAITGERGASSATRGEAARAAPRGPSPRMVRGAIALAVLALGAEAALYARGARPSAAIAPEGAAVADDADATPLLAVAPFTTIGAATDSGFAEGLADAVTNKLANLAGLRVIDRASVRALGVQADDPRAIGTELGARFALRASIRWATGADGTARVQVTPVLVRTSDGTTRWAGAPIEASPTDPFAMQAAIAGQVADALDIAIAAVERERLERPSTRDPEAWALYRRAAARAQRAERRFALDRTDVAEIAADLDGALARDGDFLEAAALRGQLLVVASQLGHRPPAARDSGLAVLRAVHVRDPGIPGVAATLVGEALGRGRPDEAERLVDVAIAARPSNGKLQLARGAVAVAMHDTAALRDALRRAIALSPRDVPTLVDVAGRSILSLRDSAFGNEVLRRAVRIAADDPDVQMGRLLAASATGDTAAMEVAWRGYRAAGGPPVPHQLGLLRHGSAAMRREASALASRGATGRTPLDTIIFLEERMALRASLGDAAGARADAAAALAIEARIDTTTLMFVERVKDRYMRPRLLATAGRDGAARALLDSLARPAWLRDTVRLAPADRANGTCAVAAAWALLRDTAAMYASLRECLDRPSGRWPAWVRREPQFTPYLGEARMQRLLAEFEPRPAPAVPRQVRR